MSLITIKTFDIAIDAHILKVRLEADEIACYLFDEHIVSMNPLYSNAIGGIKLKIHESDYPKAKLILDELKQLELHDEAGKRINCPKCNSLEINTQFRSFNSAKGIIAIMLTILYGIFPIYFKTTMRCNSCHFEFK